MKTHFILAILATSAVFVGAAQRGPSEARLQQVLQRFPDADLNKDGNLTLDEFREFRPRMQAGGTAGSARPAGTATNTPTRPATSVSAAGPVEIQITSDNPVPVNPRVYGIICEEMFVKDLVDEPEYISALTELKFKTFVYPGGSASYYHHPQGTGGFNIRPEEVRKSKHGDQSRFMKEGSGPDHFEQYMKFVKASEGEAVFTANILNGTVAELEEFLSRLQAGRIPIACVVLGVEMHLGQAEALGLDGYLKRIKPYITMLQAKYPHVPIVAHSTPVGRVGERARASFHEWNQALARLPGISGFSQYGWPEFGTEVRRLRGAAAQTPDERWRYYDEFTRTFPQRQLPAYQRDWGSDKKMYMLQWGTHLDRNTPVQGLHMANFYFFLAQYNAAHGDYFAVATSAPILAANVSKGARRGGVIYQDKIALFASYLYTKPFRHLFSGDKKLLAASVQASENDTKVVAVKAIAAVGPDGRKYLYVLNSGPAVPLGNVAVDGETLLADLPVEVESVWAAPASADITVPGASPPVKVFVGERRLNRLVLEPFSLTLLIIPNYAQEKAAPSSQSARYSAFAPVKDDSALPRVLLIGDSIEAALKQRPAGKSIAAAADEITAITKPLTDMTAEDRYKGEDGGLYGGGRNSPPEAHLKAAARPNPASSMAWAKLQHPLAATSAGPACLSSTTTSFHSSSSRSYRSSRPTQTPLARWQ